MNETSMPPRPLRFCMITTFYPPYSFGGDGVFVQRLSNELARRGHSVEVIHCVDSYRLLGGREPRGSSTNHPNVKLHSLSGPWTPLAPLGTYLTGIPLVHRRRIRQILATGFDVIHYHNLSLVGGPKCLEYGNAIKLYTPHEYWLVCPTHILFRLNRDHCTSRHCLACGLVYRRPPQPWRYTGMLQRAVKHVDAFLALTESVATLHGENGLDLPFVPLRSFLPDPTADSPLRGSTQTGPSAGQPFFLYVGRLEKLKGIETIIPIFRTYPRAQLWIAGTGDYESHLRRLAAGSPNIRFLGYQTYDRLHALYRDALAVVVPSSYYELAPLVVIEAAYHKAPVIGRSRGGVQEMLRSTGGGLLYETPEQLTAALDRICSDPALRIELGEQGYRATRQVWSADAHVDRYLELIAGIAEKRGIHFSAHSAGD